MLNTVKICSLSLCICAPLHTHTHTPQFFYVTKGQLLFDINAQQFRLKPHMSIHIPSGTHHTKGVTTSHTCTRHTHHSSLVPSLHCQLFFLHVGKKNIFPTKKRLVEETGNEAKTIPHTQAMILISTFDLVPSLQEVCMGFATSSEQNLRPSFTLTACPFRRPPRPRALRPNDLFHFSSFLFCLLHLHSSSICVSIVV